MPDAATKARQAIREAHPDAWIPVAEGDVLQGVVTDVDSAWSDAKAQNGDGFYPLLTIKTDDGIELKWHAFETVSMNEVLKRRPAPGERITVTYMGEGEQKVRGRNKPKIFRLTVAGRDPQQVAANVYDNLRPSGRVPQAGNGVAPDVPIDTAGLPGDDDAQNPLFDEGV